MNRNNSFNKTKIASVSTGKTVVDIYADCFPIEKVKIVVSEYEGNKASIDTYIDFADFLRIAKQVENKEIFKSITNSKGKGVDIYRGGLPAEKAKREDGKVVAKVLNMNMSQTGTIFINASKGAGRQTDKGAIIPDGTPDNKVSVSMTYNDCLAMFMYADLAVRAYLPGMFNQIFASIGAYRQSGDHQ